MKFKKLLWPAVVAVVVAGLLLSADRGVGGVGGLLTVSVLPGVLLVGFFFFVLIQLSLFVLEWKGRRALTAAVALEALAVGSLTAALGSGAETRAGEVWCFVACILSTGLVILLGAAPMLWSACRLRNRPACE